LPIYVFQVLLEVGTSPVAAKIYFPEVFGDGGGCVHGDSELEIEWTKIGGDYHRLHGFTQINTD
jgi:hypothetical protein